MDFDLKGGKDELDSFRRAHGQGPDAVSVVRVGSWVAWRAYRSVRRVPDGSSADCIEENTLSPGEVL
jgi:hypothetical protein